MNQYVINSPNTGKTYGPFKTAAAAAKWANKNITTGRGRPVPWTMSRLFAK